MSKSDYVAHLETQMAGVDHRIESAKKMLESGDVEGKSC